MRSHYDRYQSGEREAVWVDLLALGTSVQQEPVYSDALAVAREMMMWARTNIETLIVRLDSIGYRFETARDTTLALVRMISNFNLVMAKRLESLFPLPGVLDRSAMFDELLASFNKKRTPASTLDELSVYCRAQEWSTVGLACLEDHLKAPLPISLRAWFETIQHVSFTGSHPELSPPGPVLSDPFGIMSMPDEVDYESWDTAEGYPIAVDEFFKANVNREHRYYVNFRDSRADVIFKDWRNDYFVAYLRRVFKWGGFPGLERHPNPPLKLIGELTDGLLPI